MTQAKTDFAVKCSKLAGSLTVESLRRALEDEGIHLSARDVFIHGVPVEIDLLMPRPGAVPRSGLVYEPCDVLAALEVKNSGAYGAQTLESIRRAFGLIRAANPRILCVYVTLSERMGYRWAATDKNLGARAFTLFWHDGSRKGPSYRPSGDWSRLVAELVGLGRANS